MLLNRLEFALMNNPVRSAVQRHVEARALLRLGGELDGGHALELGCGRGVGADLILNVFGAERVDAFDLDPRMVRRARCRLAAHGSRVRLWIGDAGRISVPDGTYDAVFDFGIIHHVPDWRRAVGEVERVLKPGGRFYGEEVLARLIDHPIARRLMEHPSEDRFDAGGFGRELEAAGLDEVVVKDLTGVVAWFTARKRAAT